MIHFFEENKLSEYLYEFLNKLSTRKLFPNFPSVIFSFLCSTLPIVKGAVRLMILKESLTASAIEKLSPTLETVKLLIKGKFAKKTLRPKMTKLVG